MDLVFAMKLRISVLKIVLKSLIVYIETTHSCIFSVTLKGNSFEYLRRNESE